MLICLLAVSIGLGVWRCDFEAGPPEGLANGRQSIWVEKVFVEVEGGFPKSFDNGLLTLRAFSPQPMVRVTSHESSHSLELNLRLENFGERRKLWVTGERGPASELILPPDGRFSIKVEAGQALMLIPLAQPAPLAHQQELLSFAVLGDNRRGYEVLKKIVSEINARSDEIEFTIHLGDFVEAGGWGEINQFMEVMNPLRIPLFMVLGNHDVWDRSQGEQKTDMGRDKFEDFFGPLYHAFAYRDCYFIFLDNANDLMEENQFRWLEEKLRQSQSYGHRFVFGHVPPFDPRADGDKQMAKDYGSRLMKLLSNYRVEAAFFSHIHSFLQAQRDGVSYYITGGAGAPLADGGFYHFLRVAVSKAGIQVKVIEIKG